MACHNQHPKFILTNELNALLISDTLHSPFSTSVFQTRRVEIGHRGFKLEVFEEAFTSDHWLVRIYRVRYSLRESLRGSGGVGGITASSCVDSCITSSPLPLASIGELFCHIEIGMYITELSFNQDNIPPQRCCLALSLFSQVVKPHESRFNRDGLLFSPPAAAVGEGAGVNLFARSIRPRAPPTAAAA